MNSQPLAIEARNLRVSFGRKVALDGAQLHARKGRVYGLIGPNGAGKSTLMGTILGLVEPESGDIRINGQQWTPALLDLIGASINGPAFYPHLTAKKNLKVHSHLLGVDNKRVDDMLRFVGLDSAGRTKAKGFSTGMKGRLALAMALLGDPEILLLDEPQNGLDPEGVRALRHTIRQFADAGRTVIVSSHQLSEVAQLADDIGVVSAGRTMWEGPLADFAPGGDLEAAYFSLVTEGGQAA